MPKLIGALRVKNEEFFLEKTINEVCQYCDELAFIDDNSEDKTIEIINDVCYKNKTPHRIIKSPDKRFHEGRDKNLLLELVYEMKAEWCLAFDADEVYEYNFVKNIPQYIKDKFDVIWVGATHLWSIEKKLLWHEVNTFRIDNGWSTSFLEDGTGIQHNRPALFKIYPQLKSGSLRDHGYTCPKELWYSNNCLFSKKIFAHFGYATQSLIEKKCIRHGNIPAVTKEEVDGANYEPGWQPENFNSEAAVNSFKNEWLKKDEVKLKKLSRKIWRNNGL